jgi:nicotinamide riboside kinase
MEERIHGNSPKRIAILGPESSGKTVLSKALSQHLQLRLIEEYAREYLTENGPDYNLDDIMVMAEEQFSRAHAPIEASISDTEMSTMVIWAQDKFNEVPLELLRLEQAQNFALYLLCRPDISWESDSLRENPHDRERLFTLYEERLSNLDRPYRIISGQGKARMDLALEAIADIFPH